MSQTIKLTKKVLPNKQSAIFQIQLIKDIPVKPETYRSFHLFRFSTLMCHLRGRDWREGSPLEQSCCDAESRGPASTFSRGVSFLYGGPAGKIPHSQKYIHNLQRTASSQASFLLCCGRTSYFSFSFRVT